MEPLLTTEQLNAYLTAPYSQWVRMKTRSDALIPMLYDSEIIGATDADSLSLVAMRCLFPDCQRVLQLGTYIGFSAVVLADILAQHKLPGLLVTVDNSEVHLQKAQHFLEVADLLSRVVILKGDDLSSQIREQTALYGPFDLVYVDTLHTHDHTLDILETYVAQAPPQTVFFFHDAGIKQIALDATGKGGVRRALQDWCAAYPATHQLAFFEPPAWNTYLAMLTQKERAEYPVPKVTL